MSATTAQQLVLDAVEGAGFPAPFKELILLALSQPGRILDQSRPSRFLDVIKGCCAAAHGRADLVERVAAAFEMCIAASDILDEVEDGDDSIVCSRGGVSRALNASTALLALTFSALSGPDLIAQDKPLFLGLVQSLATSIATSTIGQDADLTSVSDGSMSTSTALEIARAKSGSLVSGAAVMGAMLGTSDPAILSLFGDFGVHLGTAYQLSNDMRDARSVAKSDVSGSKGTIPLVFQKSGERGLPHEVDESALRKSGALQFTWVLMETERNGCRRVIESLRARDQNVTSLERLVGDQ